MPIRTGEICARDYNTATGDLSGERVFCHVDRSEGGAADGATVDSEGYLWNALVYAGKLVRYTPEGKVDRIIEMPVKKVTSVMFGGETLMCCTSPPWRSRPCRASRKIISCAAACSPFTTWA